MNADRTVARAVAALGLLAACVPEAHAADAAIVTPLLTAILATCAAVGVLVYALARWTSGRDARRIDRTVRRFAR